MYGTSAPGTLGWVDIGNVPRVRYGEICCIPLRSGEKGKFFSLSNRFIIGHILGQIFFHNPDHRYQSTQNCLMHIMSRLRQQIFRPLYSA
jgi:hypothetical protein